MKVCEEVEMEKTRDLNELGRRGEIANSLRNVIQRRVKAQAAQQTLFVRQKRSLLHLLGRGPVHRVMHLVGRNRPAPFGDRTGTFGGPEAGVSNILVLGENHVLPERVLVGGSSLGGTSEEEKIPEPPFSGEGNGRQEPRFGVACGGRNVFLLGIAHDVGDSQRRQGPTSFTTSHRNSRLLLLFFSFFFPASARFFHGLCEQVEVLRCDRRRGVEGTDLSGVEELVGGEGRSVEVSGEIELEIMVVVVGIGFGFGNRGRRRVYGAGGCTEEEVGVVSEALGAGRGGDEWGGAVAVEVEFHRNHHFYFHLFFSFFQCETDWCVWKRSVCSDGVVEFIAKEECQKLTLKEGVFVLPLQE